MMHHPSLCTTNIAAAVAIGSHLVMAHQPELEGLRECMQPTAESAAVEAA
jgi:hypothetical protein